MGFAFLSALLGQYAAMSNRNYNDQVRRSQNIFNKYEAQRAREWNELMDSTKYQRTVTDMRSAGVNPALAMSGGVTTQASSSAQAQGSNVATPALDLSQVAQLAVQSRQFDLQSKQLDIQNKLADADIRLKNADADLKEKDSKYRDDYNSLMLDGLRKSNSLTDSQIELVRANIGKLGEEVVLLKRQAATEEERRLLTAAETSLRKAMERKTDQEVKNLVALLPFQKALMSAQTGQARASASAQLVHAAYEQGLIDNGYIEEMTRELSARADSAEAKADVDEMMRDIRTGNFEKWFAGGTKADKILSASLRDFTRLTTTFGSILRSILPVNLNIGGKI